MVPECGASSSPGLGVSVRCLVSAHLGAPRRTRPSPEAQLGIASCVFPRTDVVFGAVLQLFRGYEAAASDREPEAPAYGGVNCPAVWAWSPLGGRDLPSLRAGPGPQTRGGARAESTEPDRGRGARRIHAWSGSASGRNPCVVGIHTRPRRGVLGGLFSPAHVPTDGRRGHSALSCLAESQGLRRSKNKPSRAVHLRRLTVTVTTERRKVDDTPVTSNTNSTRNSGALWIPGACISQWVHGNGFKAAGVVHGDGAERTWPAWAWEACPLLAPHLAPPWAAEAGARRQGELGAFRFPSARPPRAASLPPPTCASLPASASPAGLCNRRQEPELRAAQPGYSGHAVSARAACPPYAVVPLCIDITPKHACPVSVCPA